MDPETKYFEKPDDRITFPAGEVDIVKIDGRDIGKFRFEPGWSWSGNLKPIVGGDWCQETHVGYSISGRLHSPPDSPPTNMSSSRPRPKPL